MYIYIYIYGAGPTIFTPFIFDSCVCSRMARVTTGKIRPKEMESTLHSILYLYSCIFMYNLYFISLQIILIDSIIDNVHLTARSIEPPPPLRQRNANRTSEGRRRRERRRATSEPEARSARAAEVARARGAR